MYAHGRFYRHKKSKWFKMQSLRSEQQSGLYLAWLQGYGGRGKQVFRLNCQRWGGGGIGGTSKERKKSRLMSGVEIRRKEGGWWERIRAVRIEGRKFNSIYKEKGKTRSH